MLRPIVLAISLSVFGGLAADIAAADPPRILGSHIRDRGGDHDDDRGRGGDGDHRGDHRGDRDRHHDRDGRWQGRYDDRDRWRGNDRWRDYRRGDHRHRDHDDHYSFGLFLGSPWYAAPGYYYDDYPRYRDDCRVVVRTRYDRWGRPYRERVRECYDGRYWAPYRGW